MLRLFLLLLLAWSFSSILGCVRQVDFGREEDEGSLKYFNPSDGNCSDGIAYFYTISPKKEHFLILTLTSIRDLEKANLELYYYIDKETIIFINSIESDYNEEIFIAPEGVGFQLNGTSHSLFQIDFERAKQDPTIGYEVCPYPILTADSTPQTIRTDKFPSAGCSFILKGSRHQPAKLVQLCEGQDIWNGTISAIGDYYNRWPLTREIAIEEDIHLMLTFDVENYENWWNFGCQVTYYTIKEDPCLCTQPNATIPLHTKQKLTSPGYPQLHCPEMSCIYNFTTKKSEDDGMITAWIISAVHMSRVYGDRIWISLKESENEHFRISYVMNEFNATVKEDIILIGEELQIEYTAKAKFSGDHGFSMKIEAIHQPTECMCPTDSFKILPSAGATRMEAPTNCDIMLCKYKIPFDEYSAFKMIRIKVDYLFTRSGEYFDISSGHHESRIFTHDRHISKLEKGRKVIDWHTNDPIFFTFRRENLKNLTAAEIETTVIHWSWEWLTEDYCKCGKVVNLAEEQWLILYSPMWPSNYCNEMNCTYQISAPIGYHLELNVSSFYTESQLDYVKIFDGSASSKPIETLSGLIRRPSFFEIYYQNATIYFSSDESETRKGWKIEYKAVKNKDTIIIQKGYLGVWVILGAFFGLICINIGAWIVWRKWCGRGIAIPPVDNPNYGKLVRDEELEIEDDCL